jgi:hypothetical protein
MVDDSNLELTTSDFFSRVRQNFHFLVDDYRFSVIKEDVNLQHASRTVVFQKGDLRIDVWLEYASVGIFFAINVNQQIRGFAVGDIVTFIEHEAGNPTPEFEQGHFGPTIDNASSFRDKIVIGLNWYANLLQRYMDRVLLLFEHQNFQRREADLSEWHRRGEEQVRKAIRREIYGKK